MANLLILSSPETTEIIDGAENILNRAIVKAAPKINEQLDGCFDHTDPAGLATIEPRWKAINDLAKRGVRMRYLTEIRKDNIDYCKEMIGIGIELRHIEGIKGNFGIADRIEYITILVQEDKQRPAQALVSNVKSFVEQQQYLFDSLWQKGIPAQDRIREIEKPLKPEFIETLRNPAEIQKIGYELVKSAKEDILILFSTSNSFRRQQKAGLIQLLSDKASQSNVKIRILTHINKETREMVNSLTPINKIDVRDLQESLKPKLATLIVDRKFSLEVEIKDDLKDNSYDAVRLATYSNSEPTVWSHISKFETLWVQTELAVSKKHEQVVVK
jgi:two-component system, OmpR family, sensor histidine kinase VicK